MCVHEPRLLLALYTLSLNIVRTTGLGCSAQQKFHEMNDLTAMVCVINPDQTLVIAHYLTPIVSEQKFAQCAFDRRLYKSLVLSVLIAPAPDQKP